MLIKELIKTRRSKRSGGCITFKLEVQWAVPEKKQQGERGLEDMEFPGVYIEEIVSGISRGWDFQG